MRQGKDQDNVSEDEEMSPQKMSAGQNFLFKYQKRADSL